MYRRSREVDICPLLSRASQDKGKPGRRSQPATSQQAIRVKRRFRRRWTKATCPGGRSRVQTSHITASDMRAKGLQGVPYEAVRLRRWGETEAKERDMSQAHPGRGHGDGRQERAAPAAARVPARTGTRGRTLRASRTPVSRARARAAPRSRKGPSQPPSAGFFGTRPT